MPRRVLSLVVCSFAFIGQVYSQQVFVPRDEGKFPKAQPVKETTRQPQVAKALPVKDSIGKTRAPAAQPVKEQLAAAPKAQPIKTQAAVAQSTKPQVVTTVKASPPAAQSVKATSPSSSVVKTASSNPPAAKPTASVTAAATKAHQIASSATKLSPAAGPATKPAASVPPSLVATARTMRLTKVEGPKAEPSSRVPIIADEVKSRFVNASMESAFTKLADGFDFPVGKPDAQGYYKARGFRSHGHLGEDWDGIRGGDTDLGDPIYSVGDGIVVFARDCHMGWGNVLIVRHTYRENGTIKNIDALYGHLSTITVKRGQIVARGQKVATMGNAHGLYDAHLHLEIRKNLEIGMSRAAFARDFSNYYDPTQFINSHRRLQTGGTYRVALNTFIRDAQLNFDKARNYSHSRHRGTKESAAALKKAVATKN